MGAGVVALGAAVAMPEAKAGPPNYAADGASLSALAIEDRQAASDRAARTEDRPGPAGTVEQAAPDVWLLPLHREYEITTLYEMRWGQMHYGIDMAVPYATPYYAIHSGTVILARYYGDCGNAIQIQHEDGTISQYCHSSKLLVQEGQKVETGDPIGLVGNTGQSYGDHLHLEIHVNGAPTDPVPFMLAHGVDIPKRLEAANGDVVIP